MKVRKKPIVVDARGPIKHSELVMTAHGRAQAQVGDFILRDPESGDTWPVTGRIFRETYDILEPDRTSL